MRVFLDTNVIVAATATRGLCADVMREVLTRHDLVVSAALLDEVAAVLKSKLGAPEDVTSGLVSLFREAAALSEPQAFSQIPLRDGPDRVLLSAAEAAGADVFVTGDAEILGLRTVGTMTVVSPREFWELAKGEVKPPTPR